MEVFMLFLLLLVMSCKSTESKSSLTLYRAALNYEMNDLKFNKIFIESDEDVNKKILESSLVKKGFEIAKDMFDKAGNYWKNAIRLAPNNYIEAQNWLKITGKLNDNLS